MSESKTKKIITISDYVKYKVLELNGLFQTETNPNTLDERYTFVNNINDIRKLKLKEYNIWYSGDGDELLNFYTRNNLVDYNYDPLYERNKKSYFWCVSSTEEDIKRTHSCAVKDIIDTIVYIVNKPAITIADDKWNTILNNILEDNNFTHILIEQIRPQVLVSGYTALKINWDKSISDYPILLLYKAENVDFVYRNNRVIAIIYRDYYTLENEKQYVLFEIRRIGKSGKDPNISGLYIEKELFEMGGDEYLRPCELSSVPQLRDVKPKMFISNMKSFLGSEVIYFEDNLGSMYGRSVLQGKLDLCDDLDQCVSQAANAVRLSTPIENINSLFLERSETTGLPVMPHAFNRKYVMYRGMPNADGNMGNTKAAEISQPQIDFLSYSAQVEKIFLQLIQGFLSPATFGISVQAQESGISIREKEKISVYTRNTICSEEGRAVKRVVKDLLRAYKLMREKEADLSEIDKLDVSVKYDNFADESLEKKLESIASAYQAGVMSPKTVVDILYGDKSKEEKKYEQNYIEGKMKDEIAEQIKMEEQQEKANNPMAMLAEMGLGNGVPSEVSGGESNPANNPELAKQLGDIGAEQGGNNNNSLDLMKGAGGE